MPLLLLPLAACAYDPFRAFDPTGATNYLPTAMDANLFAYAGIEVPLGDNIALVTEGDQTQSVELRLFPGQPLKNNGVRAELVVDFPYREGETVLTTWQMKFVGPFPYDEKNRWWVVSQWHDQPDRTLGQTWDGFPANSPPVLLAFGYTNSNRVLGLSYGPQNAPVGFFPILEDTWYSLSAKIVWSRGGSGSMELKVSPGNITLRANGANMLNAFQHYFKAGMYRHKEIDTLNRVRVRNIGMYKV
ncbi:MAG: heparin lyase I family protein [Spirochaetes bacterium]|nr:heparin lyase I family protein [Spirochaetota bacterium]